MRVAPPVLAWPASVAMLALARVFAAMMLAGPHRSVLPSVVQPGVFVMCWIVFRVGPVFVARAVWRGLAPAAMALVLVVAGAAAVAAQEIHVLSSGGLAAPYLDLVPAVERATGQTIKTAATSTGVGQDSIANRLRRGERADVVILPDAALRELIQDGFIVADSRVPIASSGIGMAVRAGAPKPDISSVDALRRALLRASSVAFSGSVSGRYLSNELFPRLGIAGQMQPKSVLVERERVGAVVARGEAEIGFQQISELLPIAGVDYVGPLPAEVQRVTLFSAGVAAAARNPSGARALIAFFKTPEGVKALGKYQLVPAESR